MLQQSFRRSSSQNRGLGGVRLKSREPAAVPTPACCRSTQNHRKVGRRTSVHDLRSPKLPSEQIYITMHSYVWKMWRWGQQRSRNTNCRCQNCILRQKRPYSRLSSTDDSLRAVLRGHQQVVFGRQKRTTFDVKNSPYFSLFTSAILRARASLYFECQIE